MANSTHRAPQLSIGLPVYNGERFLPQALECLLSQTFGDFEILIGDNASTDRTKEICQDYVRRDQRLRYVRHERNLGAVANFNRVFHLTTAPLFKWAAHDDLHRETYLETCVRLLDEHPDTVLAHSNTLLIDEHSEPFPFDPVAGCYRDPKTDAPETVDGPEIGDRAAAVERFWQVLTLARKGNHSFGVIRREALQQTRLQANFVTSDRTMLAELALLGRFRSSPERLFLKRLHPDVSWTLSREELKGYLSTDGVAYSRRARQLEAYFSAPRGKPIGTGEKLVCTAMVAAHCLKIAAQSLIGKEAHYAVQKSAWRNRAVS